MSAPLPAATGSYRQLDPQKVIATIDLLQRRITERFPGSGLSNLVGELKTIAEEAAERIIAFQKPNLPLRILGFALAAGIVALLLRIVLTFSAPELRDLPNFIQFLEAALNTIVFVGATILFLFSWELRIKRRRALGAIHELRSLAHIVDMHQLTKDPDRYLLGATVTASSPQRTLTPFELGRYLDYCSETLSLVSKIAAIYVQGFSDQVVLDAVDEIEALTDGLSRKIWQKITILESMSGEAGRLSDRGSLSIS